MRRLRIYADTSVFGGCFDPEFDQASRMLFEDIRAGVYKLIVSETTTDELEHAPERVKELLNGLPSERVEKIKVTPEIQTLRDAYILAGIVGPANLLDAEHIACASVAMADLIVSWNFKHIVNFNKIRGYHAVNLLNGYHAIAIHTPREVAKS